MGCIMSQDTKEWNTHLIRLLDYSMEDNTLEKKIEVLNAQLISQFQNINSSNREFLVTNQDKLTYTEFCQTGLLFTEEIIRQLNPIMCKNW